MVRICKSTMDEIMPLGPILAWCHLIRMKLSVSRTLLSTSSTTLKSMAPDPDVSFTAEAQTMGINRRNLNMLALHVPPSQQPTNQQWTSGRIRCFLFPNHSPFAAGSRDRPHHTYHSTQSHSHPPGWGGGGGRLRGYCTNKVCASDGIRTESPPLSSISFFFLCS